LCRLDSALVNRSSQSPQGLRFGIFEIDPEARELRKNGLRVKLQDQPFKILTAMARRPGEVITREELYSELSSHSVYDFKHGLNNAIQKIREALGDSPENARFIETVRGRGYRFLPHVEVVNKSFFGSDDRPPAAENLTFEVPAGRIRFAPDGRRMPAQRSGLTWIAIAEGMVIVALLTSGYFNRQVPSMLVHQDSAVRVSSEAPILPYSPEER
jgi:DNA-binding winged helix-turn-helix (wHTH) protein